MIESLPRREREVFETLCRLESGAVADVRDALADPISDSAVRTLLARLETKGLVARTQTSGGVSYRPVPRTDTVAAGALQKMIDTFFAGSAASAATALLGLGQRLTPEEAAALERAIDDATERKGGRE
ncbi:BlaI/MecI/CopY family transcriptional regulator [Brevundimonas goettingensis]|uniref:BlaI/MecI/CopY family transcriptional regulator n=1 Tax=Brevundimonas goettingensis TaxID=2774190 RepID=A0A975C1D6_9CAUL|nr:BlaI/MecI/CopY family transcriptional regulator [Brevundimonas goettingensis]QTC92068.1 BlaI/MecI/CopY family transcriptional regulator [Brevundimonas goettingensis]